MSFPDVRFDDIAGYYDAYWKRLDIAMGSVDRGQLKIAADLLDSVYRQGGTLYVCGNGGSASIANSFVGDHAKSVQTDTGLVPHVVSLTANMPIVTAVANDLSWEDVFVYQLKNLARLGDVLVAISSSGNSANVLRAAEWARQNRMEVIGFTGFDGGRLGEISTVHVHVNADNYGVIQDVHQALMHVMGQFIRMAHMTERKIAANRF